MGACRCGHPFGTGPCLSIVVAHPAFAPVPESNQPRQWTLTEALDLIRIWDLT